DYAAIADAVYAFAQSDDPLAGPVREALQVIDEAFDEWGQDRIALSFNGGKDCTVLLHLVAASLGRRSPSQGEEKRKPLPAVYIPVPSPFPQLEAFIADAARAYDLDLFRCAPPTPSASTSTSVLPVESVPTPGSAGPPAPLGAGGTEKPKHAKGGEGMRIALELYKARFPHIEAILIGTRRGDPHGAQLTFRNPTDAGWPAFVRVNPIINWAYGDVWAFLRRFRVPYCSLYDEGYTSLGSTYNTWRNPALRVRVREGYPSHLSHPNPSHPTPSHSHSHPHASSFSSPQTPATGPAKGSLPGGEEGAEQERYRPAYELLDGALERAGR
ncbi:adenine nucleotide alpha hydrolases-like protein, partial [Trametes cingulata]